MTIDNKIKQIDDCMFDINNYYRFVARYMQKNQQTIKYDLYDVDYKKEEILVGIQRMNKVYERYKRFCLYIKNKKGK